MRVLINCLLKKAKVRPNGKVPIYTRITLLRKRVELSTGFCIHPDEWDEVNQQVRVTVSDARMINSRIAKIRSEIQDAFYQLEALGQDFDVVAIKNKLLNIEDSKGILNVFDYYLESMLAKLGKSYSVETYKHYKSSRKRLGVFIKRAYKRRDIPVGAVNYKFLDAFDVFLKKDCNVHQNTAWNYHKHLRRVLNLAVSFEYIPKNPYKRFKVSLDETNREFLSMDELSKIMRKEIEIDRLSYVRDVFVFACYTGLSYADVSKLSKEHIQIRDDGKEWVIINRTKTKTRCIIPLFPNAKEILNKYSDFPENALKGRLLPVLSNQKMNSYLKELADICDIRKNLTMHMARHTFATTVTLSNGVPIETVSKVLGHTSLKTTQIYARVLESKISEDMERLQSKLHS
jgi:site-specific recombinase XerD